jgi:glycosyltransferase involved in cell wall biosynthesis
MSVSIIIPTYHRKKFEKLIEYNINLQTYFNILEVIILDDGNDEPLCIRTKYPIHYYTIPRCSIGTKRNIGVQVAQGHYIAFMDTDDFYMPDYIAHSIFEMESNNKSIAGCADMNVYDFTHFYKQRCIFLHYLNEATMVFKKSVFTSLTDANSNEAVSFLLTNIDKIIETNIDKIMCCVSHTTNTIPKEPWCTDKYKIKSVENGFNPFIQYTNHCKILSTLNV